MQSRGLDVYIGSGNVCCVDAEELKIISENSIFSLCKAIWEVGAGYMVSRSWQFIVCCSWHFSAALLSSK